MSARFVISGTGTDIGKTVFSAALMLGLGDACYWKPLQSGLDDCSDTDRVKKLTGFADDRFFPEAYTFSRPLSPHRAAEIDNIVIDKSLLSLSSVPSCNLPLVIEGAGGLMVPITRNYLQIDMYKDWNLPLILCSSSGLGTINHTLLSIEALISRNITIKGIAFIGDYNDDNIKTISEYSGVKALGCLPYLDDMNKAYLKPAFDDNFNIKDFY